MSTSQPDVAQARAHFNTSVPHQTVLTAHTILVSRLSISRLSISHLIISRLIISPLDRETYAAYRQHLASTAREFDIFDLQTSFLERSVLRQLAPPSEALALSQAMVEMFPREYARWDAAGVERVRETRTVGNWLEKGEYGRKRVMIEMLVDVGEEE